MKSSSPRRVVAVVASALAGAVLVAAFAAGAGAAEVAKSGSQQQKAVAPPSGEAQSLSVRGYADRFFRKEPPLAKSGKMKPDPRTAEAFRFIGDVFRRNGGSIHSEGFNTRQLRLEVQPFTEIINMYDNRTVTIRVAAMPADAQAEAYWANWNRVLANGRWNYRKFFRSAAEMRLLARYNVLVLTAHEYGHYFDYRYDVSGYSTLHRSRPEKPLNCTEYVADKFAVAFLNFLSQDTRFAALRPRYYALINSFNAAIPARNQMKVNSYTQLETNCGSVNILQNGLGPDGKVNTEFFRNYASAYFGRHRVLLDEKTFPALPELVRRLLTSRLPKAVDYTGDTVRIVPQGIVNTSREMTHLAFTPRGELWRFGVQKTPRYGRVQSIAVQVQDHRGVSRGILELYLAPKEQIGLEVRDPLIFSDTEILIPLFNDPSADGDFVKEPDTAFLLMGQRQTDGTWKSVTVQVPSLPRTAAGDNYHSWVVAPGGKLLLLHYQRIKGIASVHSYAVNPKDLSLEGKRLVTTASSTVVPTVVDSRGRFYGHANGEFAFGGQQLLAFRPKGAGVLLGNGLYGVRRGTNGLSTDRMQTELTRVEAARFVNANTLRIALDYGRDRTTGENRFLIHDIVLEKR